MIWDRILKNYWLDSLLIKIKWKTYFVIPFIAFPNPIITIDRLVEMSSAASRPPPELEEKMKEYKFVESELQTLFRYNFIFHLYFFPLVHINCKIIETCGYAAKNKWFLLN